LTTTINNTTKNADSSCHLEAERSNIYALLSAILIAPANSNLIDIINDCHINTDTWQALKDNFNHENLESLDDEYHRLFIGLGTGELLPYYSHYLAGCLMGKPLSNLRDDIRAMGLESQDTLNLNLQVQLVLHLIEHRCLIFLPLNDKRSQRSLLCC
jgi:TorA maturation chaperone TorD